jgi:hypothetical protein
MEVFAGMNRGDRCYRAMGKLRYFFLFVDLGFILYWLITILHMIPAEYLFQDYQNPILVAWNWSFLPLDLLISATGLSSILLYQRGNAAWRSLAMVSLVLTLVSGLQAISFWVIRGDFMIEWWIPNLFLLLYPLFFLPSLLKLSEESTRSANT